MAHCRQSALFDNLPQLAQVHEIEGFQMSGILSQEQVDAIKPIFLAQDDATGNEEQSYTAADIAKLKASHAALYNEVLKGLLDIARGDVAQLEMGANSPG